MDQQEFFRDIENSFGAGIALIKKKNADYSGAADPFKNFRSAETVGVGVDRAILVRILDKIARINNLLDKENKVESESIDDTLLDLINYSAILKAYISSTRKEYENQNKVE